jgi:phosphoribosylformylglycinamidine synthase
VKRKALPPVDTVPLRGKGSRELEEISCRHHLALRLEEMKAIQAHYQALGRDPTDVELETFAQTWSEHCMHKTFRGGVETDEGRIESLFWETVGRVTRELNPEWCFSVFVDNAGIVDFEGDWALAFKVETHNHPSAIEPFGGAATGVGGVIRDILGVWGDPIASIDVLCFGPLDTPYESLPEGMKHPAFIYRYVVAGIGHYGNNMGIPTVGGALYFDEGYIGNPLVFCGTVGLVRKGHYRREAKAGDVLLLVGGRTGRDGIHGVTLASEELDERSEETFGTAVQIGDPIEEEKVKRAILRVRDLGLGSAITDLGGGGLSSAVGETAEGVGCGAEVHLDRVPLKYPQMAPWEIWTSESQERMLLAVPPENLEATMRVFEGEEVEATPIGRFIEEKKLLLYYEGALVGEVDLAFLFGGVPRVYRLACWSPPPLKEPSFPMPKDLAVPLLEILASPNVASKAAVIHTYDHEVKGHTVLKPLQGKGPGPGDASVLRPLSSSWKGVALSTGLNPEYGKIDPYWMAASAVDEAIRNNTAVGGRRIALLDNFVWGNPELPDRLGGLVRAAQGCRDAALAYGAPYISGKDSLYNESPLGPVTPTLLISALGMVPDVRRAVTMDLKEAGDPLYLLGRTRKELGGSHYYRTLGHLGREVPRVDAEAARPVIEGLLSAMDRGWVRACHDLSEGGLGVAAAEMAFAGDIGIEIDLKEVPREGKKMREDHLLFSESNGRFLVEVKAGREEAFETLMEGTPSRRIGETVEGDRMTVRREEKTLLSVELRSLRERWDGGLRRYDV